MPARQLSKNMFYERVLDKIVEGPACHEGGFSGFGNPSKRVMFIGISPAHEEMKIGRPIVGPSADILNPLLKGAGIPRQDVYVTNMLCWWKNDPSDEEADKCWPRLLKEIRTLKPKIIIPLGELVTKRFYPNRKMHDVRGSVIFNNDYNAYIMPTYHPAAPYHSITARKLSLASSLVADIFRDLCKIPTVLAEWPENDSLQYVKYTVVKTKEEAQYVLDHLPTDRPVAIDVETSNKDVEFMDVFVDRLLCLSISDGVNTWWFNRDILDDLNWPCSTVKWIMHYGIFDAQVIHRHLGVWLEIAEDTLLQSYTLEERGGYHALKPNAREYNGAGFWEEGKSRKNMETVPIEKMQEYNSMDSFQTVKLTPKFKAMQIEDDVRGVYETLIMPALNIFKRIQYRGVRIDQDLIRTYAVKWGTAFLKIEEDLLAYTEELGWEEEVYGSQLNLDSPKQLSKFLYEILGLPKINNSSSTAAPILEILRSRHDFVDRLVRYRHVAHMYRTYILGMMEQIKYDGNIHPVVKLHGTVTGRLAYTDPGVQTIPRPYEVEDYDLPFDRLRRLFIPQGPKSERCIIEADYGKAEIWTAQFLSGDTNLLRKLMTGDVHTENAMEILDKPRALITGNDRRDMKIVIFGIMYGQGANGLAPHIHRTVHEAQDFIDSFMESNEQYADYYNNVKKRIIANNELVTKTGRKRRIMVIGGKLDNRTQNQALNYEIQSTASDCLLSSTIELYWLLQEYDAHIMFSVHDSIVVDAPKKHLPAVLKLIHDVMTKARFPEVGINSIPVEIKVGSSWGRGKIVHSCESPNEGCMFHGYKIEPRFDTAA